MAAFHYADEGCSASRSGEPMYTLECLVAKARWGVLRKLSSMRGDADIYGCMTTAPGMRAADAADDKGIDLHARVPEAS